MKRLILLVIACMLLCGCNQASSIAVIGGSDGPTSVFVAQEDAQKTEVNPVRVIKVNGSLYYDSGLTNNIPRCGNLDGGLVKAAGAYEIPKNDGEANFEPTTEYSNYFGYQSLSTITKDVPIDGNWVVFKKEQTTRDYKYCFKIKGTHPNASKSSEYIVFANTTDITFEQITKYLFSSQLKDHNLDIHLINIGTHDEWGIFVYAENISPKGITFCCEQFGGFHSGELQTGSAYTLEVLQDEKWVVVDTISNEPLAWNSMAYLIPNKELTKWDINFEYAYGSLNPGKYRVGKNITDFKSAGDCEQKTYYTEFEIED